MMKCLCPDCSNTVELQEPSSEEKGGFTPCPECSQKVWLNRENFALRAYKKDWKVFCSHCGEEVGPDYFCQSCHALFPDYWVVQKKKPAQRVSHDKGFSFSFERKAKAVRQETFDFSEDEEAAVSKSGGRKKIVYALLAIVLISVLGAGFVLYQGMAKETAFNESFVKTLYVIKMSQSMVDNKLKKVIEQQTPLDKADISSLNSSIKEVDMVKGLIIDESGSRSSDISMLNNFYQKYVDLYDLARTAAGTEPDLPDKIERIHSEIQKAEGRLKSGMSEGLREEIQAKVLRYPPLKSLS